MIFPSQRVLRRLRRYRRPIYCFMLVLFTIDALFLLHSRPRTTRTLPSHSSHHGSMGSTTNTSVFIVSVHRNTEEILPAWSAAVISLIEHLGASNVYFSALESGSQDKTKEALTKLKNDLDRRQVPNTISLGMTVWEQLDEMWARPDPNGPRQEGWIWNQEDQVYDLRRIPYLARERNRAMEPLKELEREGRTFDKVLWLNDVVFDTEDFTTLLGTRDGNYAAACSMDYKKYPYFYDTFALRDDLGQKAVSEHWPWFLSPTSRESAQQSEPVRVESCWNGMVLFDGAPFYANPPLRFRGIADSLADMHLEASECCLIHADNALSAQPGKGVWLNPNVRVGYSVDTYQAVQGKQAATFPGAFATVIGAWANRWLRWRGSVQQHLEGATIMKRLARWQEAGAEPGHACLINEKQIMWMNGWRHL